MRAMFIYTLHSFLFEFYPIDIYIYIYHVETMRISSGYAHFRNDSNSPRLHRIFPAETEVDNARITLPFSTFFSRIINSSTGRRGNAHIFSLSLCLYPISKGKRYVSLACVNFREKVIRGEIKRKMSLVERVESVVPVILFYFGVIRSRRRKDEFFLEGKFFKFPKVRFSRTNR